MMRTDTSSTSNDSSHRESDNVSGDLVHMGSPPLEGDTSFHSSAEEPPHILPLRGPSPNPPFRPHSPESAHGIRPRSRGSSHDPTTTSNSRLRLSLTSVLDAVKEITSRTSRSRSTARLEERERGRSRVRTTAEEQNSASILEVGEGVGSPGNSSQLGPNASHGHSEHREHYLLGLGRILGLERDHEKEKDGEQKSKEHGESWREFKPGGSFPWNSSSLFPCLTKRLPGNGRDFKLQVPTASRSPSYFHLIFRLRFPSLMARLTTLSRVSLTGPAPSRLNSLATSHY